MSIIQLLPLIPLLSPLAWAFSFTIDQSSPTQCQTLNVQWQGGSPPFYLTIMPSFDYPSNLTLPRSAWNSSSSTGSYDWTLDYPTGTKFAAMMSDSTGAGTGGVSNLYTVGSPTPYSSCTLRPTATDFEFYLNETSVAQCQPVQIYWDSTAVAPITILGVIPGGQPFQFESIGTSTNLVWNVNIAAGTQFILAAFDRGLNGQGGSSKLQTVGPGVGGCLDDSSPSSTPAVPTTTASTSSGTKMGATRTTSYGGVKTVTAITTAKPTGAAGLSGASIAGIAVGAIVIVLILQGLVFFFCCRRQFAALLSHKRQMKERQVKPGNVDLISTHLHDEVDGSMLSVEDVGSTGPRGLALSTSRTRGSGVEYEEDGYDMQSVSPFWDNNADSSPTTTHNNNVYSGPFDTPPSEAELEPPLGRWQPERRGSNTSIHNGNSPSPSIGPFDSSDPLLSRHSPNPLPATTSTSTSLSKAAEVAAVAEQRRDRRADEFGGRERPSGGFRRHEDAGRVDLGLSPPGAGREEVEDLPPLYQPEWEEDSRRRR